MPDSGFDFGFELGFDFGIGHLFFGLGLAPEICILIFFCFGLFATSSHWVRSTANPFEAIMHRTWARSSIPDFFPDDWSIPMAVTDVSFNIDLTRPVKIVFGPTSIKVETLFSAIVSILSIKLTGFAS